MYVFVLALFLSAQPEMIVRFMGTYESKQACEIDMNRVKQQLPENIRPAVQCLQLVDPNKVKDI